VEKRGIGREGINKKMKYSQKKSRKLIKRKGFNITLKKRNLGKDLGGLGIIARRNKKITEEEITKIKLELQNITINKIKLIKLVQINEKIYPNKVFTQKGILVRMGKGKGKIKNKGLYIIKKMICFELFPLSTEASLILNNKNKSILNSYFFKFLKKYNFLDLLIP